MSSRSHILVFVPGYLGSTLADTQGPLWLSVPPSAILNPKGFLQGWARRMAYPNPLTPTGVVDQIAFAPPLVKQEEYSRLFDALAAMGYRTDPRHYTDVAALDERALDVYAFAYDWRQDNRRSAELLRQAVERWRALHPDKQVWMLAHSNGGVVARWYIEQLGGKDVIKRLMLFGSPWDGTPKVMRIGFDGFDTLLRKGFDAFDLAAITRDLFRTFPSLYQLLPVQNAFLHDVDNHPVSAFDGAGWLTDPGQRDLLEDGRRFTTALGDRNSVETLCFFGRKIDTFTHGLVRKDGSGRWTGIEWDKTEAGDGTIPVRSAVHPSAAQQLPFNVNHGNIYVAPAVLEFLDWELGDKTKGGLERALLLADDLQVSFNPDRDAYAPGEPIRLAATVRRSARKPISDAVVTVTIEWRGPLPGDPAPDKRPRRRRLSLGADPAKRGRYSGELTAPKQAGHYALLSDIAAPGQRQVRLEELIEVG